MITYQQSYYLHPKRRSSYLAAFLTWCSSKTFERHARRVLRSPPNSYPADVARRSRLTCLHHWPYWNLGEASRLSRLLGAGWRPWRTDLDCVCAWLLWMTGGGWIPRAGWRWWDNERDMDLLDSGSGIWQRSRSLWSQGNS